MSAIFQYMYVDDDDAGASHEVSNETIQMNTMTIDQHVKLGCPHLQGIISYKVDRIHI